MFKILGGFNLFLKSALNLDFSSIIVTELFDHRSFFPRKTCKSLTPSDFFLTGEISPKREFQNQKFENEVNFESFSLSQKVKTEKRKKKELKIIRFSYLVLCMYVAKNMEG
jgi:hypothetical protein